MKTSIPTALRFTPSKVSQTFVFDCIKKSVVHFFLLVVILFLNSCTDSRNAPPVVEELEPEKQYYEFEGAVDMGEDLTYIKIGGSNNLDWEEYIEISWEMGEHITFEIASKLEFESNSGEIFGGNSCRQYSCTGDEYETQRVTFIPEAVFWTCIERENCDPGDEVFEFVISVWDPDAN